MEKRESRKREDQRQRELWRNRRKRRVEKIKRMRTKRRDGGWCRSGVEGDKGVRKGGSGKIDGWGKGGEGPKVTRGLRMTEVVIVKRRDGAARKESGPRGVAEEGCDRTGIALIVTFWRNGASRRSQ